MRLRNFLIAVAVLALAVPGFAQAESGFKVTGGGQSFAGEPGPGPGDTFGFNAQDTDGDAGDAAKGNLNHIDRSDADDNGKNEGKGTHYKGAVDCLIALAAEDGSEGAARFGGELREPAESGETHFVVDVTDNGEGQGEDDLILFRLIGTPDEDETACDAERNDQDVDAQLARGNVQIHNYEAPEEEEEEGAAALLLGL